LFNISTKLKLALAVTACAAGFAADSFPSGQRQIGQAIVEPAYAQDGTFTYLMSPINASDSGANRAMSPVYIVVYPTDVSTTIGPVNCFHQPEDNCPEHGPGITAFAQANMPNTYKPNGVYGHDHIVVSHPDSDSPNFSVTRLPIVALFTTPNAAFEHITTLEKLNAAVSDGRVKLFPLAPAAFHGSTVSAAVFQNATPLASVPSIP
jgi:hypothetical protein